MPNNVINKVVYGDRTLIDLTDTTATAETILSGYGAYGADGVWVDGTATAGSLSGHVWQDNEGYIHLDDDGGDMYITTPLNVTTNGTYTAPTGVAYTPVSVQVSSSPTLQSKSVTPTESAQTVTADTGYDGLSQVDVGAISSSYVGSGVTRRTASDMYGEYDYGEYSVHAPKGYYAASYYKAIPNATINNPTATKGAVSNHSVSVTPSVQIASSGYTLSGTKTGTAVTVTASELASGNKAITENGSNIDVVGYSTVSVAVPGATYTATLTGTPSETSAFVRYNNTYYYTVGDEITFSAGDTMTLSAMGVRYGGDVSIDGTVVASDPDNGVNYNYTLPNHDIIIDCASGSTAHLSVTFPTISITSNGNKQDVHEYYYADVNVSGGATYTATIVSSDVYDASLCRATYNNTIYYAQGATFTFSENDTVQLILDCGAVSVDGTVVASDPRDAIFYRYTLPAHDIEITLSQRNNSIDVDFPTLSITQNGKHNVSDYYYADVNVSGGGGGAEQKQINFIDYDGTIVESYTASEWANVSALPSNPSHTGLVAQGWNWTIAQIDAQLTALPTSPVWVGQLYTTTSGHTEIDIDLPYPLQVILRYTVNGTIDIDWGDGQSTAGVTGTSITVAKSSVHNYSAAGSYTIQISNRGNSSYEYSFMGRSGSSASYELLSGNLSESLSAFVKNIRFGAGVKALGTYAFKTCRCLETVTMSNEITTIDTYVFDNADSLGCIVYPSNITTFNRIGTAYSLERVSLPYGVTSIGEGAFNNARSLSSVTVSNNVASLGTSAFYGSGLRFVVLPNNISVGMGALSNCFNLKTIDGAINVSGAMALTNGYALESVTLSNSITTILGQCFYNCYSLKSVIIPSNVTEIASNAFTSCSSLTTITIPSSVTTIGNSAFSTCACLREIHLLPTTPPTLGTNSFQNNAKLYVPYSADHSVLEAYQTAWTDLSSRIYEESP